MILYLFQNLPDNIHEMASGKLHISSTDAYTGENILISSYHSKKEVIDVSIMPQQAIQKKLVKSNISKYFLREIAFLAVLNFVPVQKKLIFGHF